MADNSSQGSQSKFWNPVFIISLAISLAITLWAVVFNENFSMISNEILNFLEVNFGWLYLLSVLAFVFFSIAIAASKYGKVKLGPDDSKPEYSTISWFAMLFGCGMGIGLIFWGLSEPICHFAAPMAGIDPGTDAAAMFAMRSTFMDWGFHAWAIFCVMGLGLAYVGFRKNKPQLVSSVLEPLIGEKNAKGWLGKLVDILAIFATVCGIVTSLGLGTMQISAGLEHMTGGAIPNTLVTMIIIVVVISVVYIGTAVIGIDKGIQTVGNINLVLAVALVVLCFILGPSVDQLNNLVGGMGAYFQNFFQDSLLLSAYGDNGWSLGWRVFYWAWWIAWAPFVGMFIARISRGRTIREFVAGVMLVPSIVAIIWCAVLGSMGLSLWSNGVFSLEKLTELSATPEVALFETFAQYPLGIIISIIAIVLVCTFFITSANSGTFALSMLSSNGDQNPSKTKMMFWGLVQSALAIGMLMAGGLKPLQTMSVGSAFPFMFVLIAVMFAIPKALASEGAQKGADADNIVELPTQAPPE
ncbi:MAG: BCCT family transporter [Eggerthellaceae bacterium]|nr:BCCT family transporter [Eggerthellaceae bacterium]